MAPSKLFDSQNCDLATPLPRVEGLATQIWGRNPHIADPGVVNQSDFNSRTHRTVMCVTNIYQLARTITNMVTFANVRGLLRMRKVVDCYDIRL